MPSLPRGLRPLRHSAYRRLAAVLVLSLLGEGLWILTVVWQVVALGGGPAELSAVHGTTAAGTVVTALAGGVLADRVPQKRVLVGVQATQAAAVGVVAVLSLAGLLTLAPLVIVGGVIGLAGGLAFPAYSALLPSLVDAEELQAVNGLEGVFRPTCLQAAGPALAGVVVAASSPGAALAVTGAASLTAFGFALALPPTAVRRDLDGASGHPVAAVLHDLRQGFAYMIGTRWLLVTLLFASLMVLAVLGPLEVLVAFAVRDRAGGGPAQHSLVLFAHGLGGALASLAVGSMRLPRRYLTGMISVWALACVPMTVFGFATSLWPMVVAGFVIGALFNAPQVVWGTLLQRRVPPYLLGRVSSLDFFVSLALMPVSMALAGPVSGAVGLTPVFVVAGLAPLVIGAVALAAGRLGPDELAHPLGADPAPETASPRP